MPTCGGSGSANCTDACACLITEDGFFANRPQDGRANTVVTGNGTPEDPFTVSFMQSEFYQPASQEIISNNTKSVLHNTSTALAQSTGVTFTTVYQSPNAVFVAFPVAAPVLAAAFGEFKVVGASVTFQTSSLGARYMSIIGQRFDAQDYIIAGSSCIGHTGGSAVLACSGWSNGIFDDTNLLPTISNTRLMAWGVGVWQTSTVTLSVSNIKFWMSSI